ncbi:MAG: hypothetical protein HYX40_00985 [Sphingobacteriales bacterium]|nr:hypothetical protein [Sphingobacteriales bacterium]
MQPGFLISKNEVPYLLYEGKGIRSIIIKEYGFEKTFSDTTKEIKFFGKKFINRLHQNTNERVIRNNLFIREKTKLNPILVADNERYLRSLEYIHDARIIVSTIADEPDSVDLLVITKDFLSISFGIKNLAADHFRVKAGDANLLGTGQKLEYTALYEKSRNPRFGYELLYRKTGIAGTFINATLGYSKISPDLYNGSFDEHSWHVMLERPLVSQYLHFAGAVMFGHGLTFNTYFKPDSLFYKYQYNVFDAWLGYNLGIHRFLFSKKILSRQFLSLRYFKNQFADVPYQVGDKFNFRLNSREAVLAQFTFFRQNFYKTNYVFGFGITEDVPYGYNIAVTAGWYKQLTLKRPYAGMDANLYMITNKGHVIQYFLRGGVFFNRDKWQDAVLLAGTSAFSKVYGHSGLKIRQYLRLSYTKQFNRLGLDPLGINNVFGLQYISFDSASGKERFSLHAETIFFLKYKMLGFKFAPFASADITSITPEYKVITNSGFYYGVGGGIRARNENILLGTVELRFMYFPRKSEQHKGFKISATVNLHFRYNNNYVKAPDIIQYNSDFSNNIY